MNILTHSVTHKLVLELSGNSLNIVTINKELHIVSFSSHDIVDSESLDNILKELPEIYSEVSLLISNADFITIPESFLESDINKIFALSYNLNYDFVLNTDKTELGICIVYPIDISLVNLIKKKFTRINIQNESSIIIRKIFKEINLKKSIIFITINSEKLNLYVIKENILQLCNSYFVKSLDDVFYFVMLTIEQLHLQPDETELVILGEPPDRKAIFELFKNYIKEINIWLEEYKFISNTGTNQKIESSFALQQLICGL